MPYHERDGVRLYFESNGAGPAVLLSHGYSATSGMWRGQVEGLKKHFRLVTWDMRGHGRTDSPADAAAYSEAETVEDIAALLDACGVERAVIGGLSLGGFMSLAFYRTYPRRVRALMLFDTGPGYKNADARAKWNARASEWATALETEGLDGLARMGTSDEMRKDAHRSAQGLAHAARGMLSQFDSRIIETLPSVNVPALVLVGADDVAFIAPTDYMAAKIPGSKKVVIPAAGHAANLHQPAAFNQAVLEFLKGLPE